MGENFEALNGGAVGVPFQLLNKKKDSLTPASITVKRPWRTISSGVAATHIFRTRQSRELLWFNDPKISIISTADDLVFFVLLTTENRKLIPRITLDGIGQLLQNPTLKKFVDLDTGEDALGGLLGQSTQLKCVGFGGDFSNPSLLQLIQNTNLISLVLARCIHINDESASLLFNLRKLKKLDLTRTAITDETLKTLALSSTLVKLRLEDTQVTSKGVAELARIATLSEIDLRFCTHVDDTAIHPLCITHVS